ncbi:signal peptide peptidase SppA [Sulfurimonas sp. HSL-1716]|uniref:signal peptide peptidase SppA n=1 Tax=Hydrocurvibacter sulfurireducens TaxID=3131937 RepID=UPI0031F85F91
MEGLKKLFLPITATVNFIQNHFKAMVFILIVILIFMPKGDSSLIPHNLEKISLTGPIMDVSEIVKKIDDARLNERVKGVLMVVNSPGGAVAPSIEVAYAIKRLRRVKPVVVYASGTIASGSYYSSIWANEIIANPGSMVGSIGVIMQGANLSEIMHKIGIKSQVVMAGKYKQLGTPDREWLPYEKAELNKVIQDTYNMFVNDVASARRLKIEDAPSFANAHIFTASQAKAVGLIDKIGVSYDAQEELIRLSGVKTPLWNKEDPMEEFIKKISAQAAVTLNTYFPALVLK